MLKNLNPERKSKISNGASKGISTPIAIGIILLVAVVAGGIFAWQYQKIPEEEALPKAEILPEDQDEDYLPTKVEDTQEVVPVEKTYIEPEVILATEQVAYDRSDPLTFTILNNFPHKIFLYSSSINPYRRAMEVEFQRYNADSGDWKTVIEHTKLSRIRSVSPQEEWRESIHLRGLLDQLAPSSEIYKLAIFYYYRDDSCPVLVFRYNEEVCQGKALSNEFVVKGGVSKEMIGPVVDFCRKKDRLYYYEKGFFLNFDEDKEEEIIGLCWKGEYKGLLFVLDKQNDKYNAVWEKEGEKQQRYYTFENLEIMDIDEDGIHEILYEEKGWWISGSDTTLHLYSPRYSEEFELRKSIEKFGGEKTEITSSSNLDLEEYRVFKEFLEQRI